MLVIQYCVSDIKDLLQKRKVFGDIVLRLVVEEEVNVH